MQSRNVRWDLGRFMLLIITCVALGLTGVAPAGASVTAVRGPTPTVQSRMPKGPRPVAAAAPFVATASSGLFLNWTHKTDSASIAVDAGGSTHLGYAPVTPFGDVGPAYYADCASNCGSLANWATASVSDGVSNVLEVDLALEPARHPRMLLYSINSNAVNIWQYAACDSACTNGVNWTVFTVTVSNYIDLSGLENSLHNFALDPQGRPRYVYYDNNGVHTGTYYVFCDTACTTPANWSEFQLSPDLFSQFSLAFTTAGQPRLVAVDFTNSGPTGNVDYLACDADCTNSLNWTKTELYARGGGRASWVLRLDASDRPRMAFYQAGLDNNQGNVLYYVWCNAGCITAGNWGSWDVGLAKSEGTDPVLALDGQDHPRIAYQTSANNLAYGACNANCESQAPSWQHHLVETHSALDADWLILPPVNCSFSFWLGGYWPSLALDVGGNARVGYVGQHIYSGGGCLPKEDYRAVRFVSFSGGVQSFLDLPLIER